MIQPKIYILSTAKFNYRHIIRNTEHEWGAAPARLYAKKLKDGFRQIPEAYKMYANSEDERTGITDFRLLHVEHHYIAYKVIDDHIFVICAILYERMDIPNMLEEISSMTAQEYEAIMGSALVLTRQ